MGGHDHEYINVMSEIKILGKQAFPAINYQSGWYLLTFLIIGGGYASEGICKYWPGLGFFFRCVAFCSEYPSHVNLVSCRCKYWRVSVPPLGNHARSVNELLLLADCIGRQRQSFSRRWLFNSTRIPLIRHYSPRAPSRHRDSTTPLTA